jgi:hypothetical protein
MFATMTPPREIWVQSALGIVTFACLLVAACGDDSPGGSDACVDGCLVDAGPDGSAPGNDCDSDDDCAGGTCNDDGQCSGPECSDDEECESGICTSGACALPACDDDVENGAETGTDCGGPECDPCEGTADCVEDSDCEAGTCIAMVCVLAESCTDGEENGTETALDCGGDCEPCDDGETCEVDDDCDSGSCDGTCVAAECDDEARNGEETDVDCGGSECDPCADTLACVEDTDCESAVCTDDECAGATCEDGAKNGGESGIDCGGAGSCDRCERGAGCTEDEDCDTEHCGGDECVVEPTAAFTLTTLLADIGQELTATSTATADGAIETIEYDWGAGFGSEAAHVFSAAGDFVVTQRVTDEFGLTDTTSLTVNVSGAVRLSATDKTSNVFLSDNGLELGIINTQEQAGVRSNVGVAAGSGVWYYEVTYTGRVGGGFYGGGATASTVPLTDFLGASTQSIGMNAAGQSAFNDMLLLNVGHKPTVGFVVDYRGANPIVHLITSENDTSVWLVSRTLTITTPVFAGYGGIVQSHGYSARFNFGADTENHPFALDPVAALNAATQTSTATALVLGFGSTRARPHSAPPVIDLADEAVTVPVNTEVTLTATATDAEDGSLTADLHWENMAQSFYDRENSDGGSFTFTPTEIGRYPIHVYVKDSAGVLTEETVMVTVTGTLPQVADPRLVADANTGAGVMISPDGLSALFTGHNKMGVRANQGNYGRFWYFEMRRLITPAENIGGGLVVSRGSLNPLAFISTQPSLQVNFLGGAWRALIFEYTTPSPTGYYGFAVDYRGDNPIVHIIVDNVVIYTMTLDEVWVPIYPMLYGNPTDSVEPYDSRLNLGGTAFQNNPVTALTNAGISTTGFQPYWGDAND